MSALPLYLFRCKECGHKFEKLTSISRMGETVCEKCGARVERVYDGVRVFGGKSGGGSSCSCGGNCAGCAGCSGDMQN